MTRAILTSLLFCAACSVAIAQAAQSQSTKPSSTRPAKVDPSQIPDETSNPAQPPVAPAQSQNTTPASAQSSQSQSTQPPAANPPQTKPVDPNQIPEESKPPQKSTGQSKPQATVPSGAQVDEPPEEDADAVKDKPCVLNPLEADRNINTGNFYFKKGNYGAAANRYKNAACWDPSKAEAFLKLGEADEKMHNFEGERDAYKKYLQLAPDAKNAPDIKKRLVKLMVLAPQK